MNDKETPRWPPFSIHIATYCIDKGEEPEPSKIAEQFYERYGGIYSDENKSLDFRHGSLSGHVREIRAKGSHAIILIAGSPRIEGEILDNIPSYDEFNVLIQDMKEALKEPDFKFELKVAYASNEKAAKRMLGDYLKKVGLPLKSVGIMRGSILAMLDDRRAGSMPATVKEAVVIPYGRDVESSVNNAWAMCVDVSFLTDCLGSMDRLYSERRLMFEQIDASEESTQIRINEILAAMRRPLDEIRPEGLEDILKEITIQFSRLSTLANSMRRDHIKAQSILRDLKRLLRGWDERPVDEVRTNSSVEIDGFESLIAPFGDFVARTEALMAQLDTVLDSVRTYLGIQQQKMSLREQLSSKDQLVQLVNLQETLHKLEVLIVAFYLTEMARIVFESAVHEAEFLSPNLLTAAFIPFALLISVLLSRILHKKH